MSEEFNSVEEPAQEDYANPYATQEPQPIVETPKSNLIAGLVGAFLGSLIGAALWVIIYKVGFIAGIAGAVTTICAMKGYEMFGKSLDKKGVICCVLIAVITIFLANRICWAWLLLDEYVAEGYEITFFDVFPLTESLLTTEGLGYYFKDLLIGYGLTVWASYKDVINAFKAAK